MIRRRAVDFFEDGKENGPSWGWYKNGKKAYEKMYKDENLLVTTVWMPEGVSVLTRILRTEMGQFTTIGTAARSRTEENSKKENRMVSNFLVREWPEGLRGYLRAEKRMVSTECNENGNGWKQPQRRRIYF